MALNIIYHKFSNTIVKERPCLVYLEKCIQFQGCRISDLENSFPFGFPSLIVNIQRITVQLYLFLQ